MDLASVSEEDLGRTLRFRVECDATALRLNATEGYLLSRIDGHTPWRVLREIGGMAPPDVDVCIEEWIAAGVVEMCAPVALPRAPRKPMPEPPERTPGEIDESQIDEGLDLDLETQRQILDFESRLGSGYARLLGVSPDAEVKEIKRAYRRLSREYHPDRYFRREIGAYEGRLEAIFKKVSEAYELLSDPATRAEVQKAEAISAQSAPPAATASTAGDTPAESSRPLTPIERLRQRMPFKIPETVLAERRQRARGFFDSARTWAENGHYLEAASGIRLAIAFDPYEEKYKQIFAEIQAGLAEQRVRALTTKAGDWHDETDFHSGLKLCDEALLYKPHDPELNATAARVAIGLKDTEKAREYLDTALEHSPDVGRYHRLLAEIHRLEGSRGHAIRELERAIALDSTDDEAKRLLSTLKPRRRAL